MLLTLLAQFSWQELRQHPWRHGAAVLAVTLGVALAFSVQLINASALSEFSQAVRSVNGQPDLELRATQGTFDETLYQRVAQHPDVAVASPILELATFALAANGQRQAIRVIGLDALVAAALSPALMPVPDDGQDRLALFAPGTLYLNASARQSFHAEAQTLKLQLGLALRDVTIAGRISVTGPALAVMDIGAAQDLFGRQGELSRIDLRLRDGVDRAAFTTALRASPGWPLNIATTEPSDAAQRVSNLSRAYRVNLTVLALVALFTGAFLVFSVQSLSVARRMQQFALLAVLGLSARERLRLVLLESLVLGLVGSAAGIALGSALAALALSLLGGDLGGGYFSGVAPALQWSGGAAVVYGGLGLLAALAGGWWPARAAERLPPAATLKGMGSPLAQGRGRWLGLLLIAAGGLLTLAPPVAGIALAAYLAVALLLVGGITVLPPMIALLYGGLSRRVAYRLLPMLAVERARRVRESASVAVSGVVAALSLAVALTVMVASFRDSVTLWLDSVLPADLYVRTTPPGGGSGGAGSGTTSGTGDSAYFTAAFVQAVGQVSGVVRVGTQRTRALLLDSGKPAVTLIAREIGDPSQALPLVGNPLPVPPGQIGIYVSEAMVDLYGAAPGTVFSLLSESFRPPALSQYGDKAIFFVASVWRDYARQFGAIAIDQRDFVLLTGDARVNDLALSLSDGANMAQVQQAIRALAEQAGAGGLVEFAPARQIRAVSLGIFDRSFAVTYWLQAVAIAIGLFGVAASFSAQVLARRKEFGLLAHLGLTRRQILTVVAGEGAAWTLAGALAGVGLGLAVALVLVHVVNPQSFHWTMDLSVPWLRLMALAVAVVLAGTGTAWLAGRAAADRQAVLAVKEDW